MALAKTASTPFGFEATDAYHRVEGVALDSKTAMSFSARSYKESAGVAAFADERHHCAYDLHGANPVAQAYAYLKTLDAFKDAQDC